MSNILILWSFCTLVCGMCCAESGAGGPGMGIARVDLGPADTSLLAALERALVYMTDNYDNMDIDGYFGVAIAQGQLASMKKDGTELKIIWSLADYLLQIARSKHFRSKIGRVGKKLLDPESWRNIGSYFNKTLICSDDEEDYQFYDNFHNSPNENESDMCLTELIDQAMANNKSIQKYKDCEMSSECKHLLTKGESWGYSLTHRILYKLISQALGCEANIPVEKYCCKVMDEVKKMHFQRYPTPKRDLFLEQILVCTLSGYGEFLQNGWLQLVLDWQRFPGCWGKESSQSGNGLHYRLRRISLSKSRKYLRDSMDSGYSKQTKRSSRSLGYYNCSTHTSGLGVALLAVGLRQASLLQQDSRKTNKELY